MVEVMKDNTVGLYKKCTDLKAYILLVSVYSIITYVYSVLTPVHHK